MVINATTSGSVTKCIGGGAGIRGNVIIENCVFLTNFTDAANDISWHGLADSEAPIRFNLTINNCYFLKRARFSNAWKTTDQIYVNYNNNSSAYDLSFSSTELENAVDVYKFNNEVRS
jgi:hypothetical protein